MVVLYIILLAILLFFLGFLAFYLCNEFFLFCFLLVDYSLGAMQNTRDYPPVPMNFYFKNYWTEIWYVLGKYYLWPLKFFNLTVNAKKKSNTAILLIHGYYRHQADWYWFRKQLAKHNHPIFMVNLSPALGSIEDITKQSLPDKIAQIKQETGCDRIILIGHSMGGLVASYYATHLDQAGLISTIITIGSPFYGTKISIMGAGENAKQMCPGSVFLVNLRERVKQNSHKIFQVLTRFDNIVFPWRSASLDDIPENQQLILPTAGHLAMLHSEEVVSHINNIIARL